MDCADSQPCLGTCGIICWSLKVHGRLFHSGLPHKSVNPIELGNVALAEILRRFYADFPAHAEEAKYNYVVSSSMKPTQVRELVLWPLQRGRSLCRVAMVCPRVVAGLRRSLAWCGRVQGSGPSSLAWG